MRYQHHDYVPGRSTPNQKPPSATNNRKEPLYAFAVYTSTLAYLQTRDRALPQQGADIAHIQTFLFTD